MKFRNQLLFDLSLLFLVVVMGTTGYKFIEHWSWLDALYMSVITLTTVGFGEVHTLDTAGKIFTMCLIVVGLGTITYTLGSISSFFFRGKFYFYLQEQHMKKILSNLKNHMIICGASNTSLVVMDELKLSKQPFVLVESNEERLQLAIERVDCAFIKGDATDEYFLEQAGIHKAKGLVAALGNDHDDVYLIMTAREMNKKLTIYAKLKEEESRRKMKLAGADIIINPYEIGGMRIASMILRPGVVKFMDELRTDPQGLRIEEIYIDETSVLFNKHLLSSDVQELLNARILALKKKDSDSYMYNFQRKKILFEKGDRLFVLEGKN